MWSYNLVLYYRHTMRCLLALLCLVATIYAACPKAYPESFSAVGEIFRPAILASI